MRISVAGNLRRPPNRRMNIRHLMLSALTIWFLSKSNAAQFPCGPQGTAQNCSSIGEGWHRIAVQRYDKESPTVSIWEKSGQRVICADPGLSSCAAYGGDLEQFKADAARETAARASRVKEQEDRQAVIDARRREEEKDQGQTLKTLGWREVARCDDGHQWAYVIEKAGERRRCLGINARGGPSERPCRPFAEDLKAFRKVAADAKKYLDAYDEASRAGRIAEFLDKKTKEKSIPQCWSASDRD